MALPPQMTSDAFLREVEDEVRRDKALTFARRWGATIAVLVVLALVLLAVGLWWQARRYGAAEAAAERETALIQSLGQGQRTAPPEVLAALSDAPGRGYPAAAALLKADLAILGDNANTAAAGFRQVAEDTHLPQPLRDAATVRLAATEFDTVAPAATIARLHALAAPGNAWFGTAGELSALAYMRMGKTAQAGALLAAVAQDRGVPISIRARASQLASSLGVDAGDLGEGAR